MNTNNSIKTKIKRGNKKNIIKVEDKNIVINENITHINDNTNKPRKNKRKREDVSKEKETEFTIPRYNEYNLLLTKKYKVPELKSICKHYKLKQSGNKIELIDRIFHHLKFSCSANIIQKIWRQFLNNRYNSLRGPARVNRELCVNETDFYSLESIKNIPYKQFFSFTDSKGTIYGCDILSIASLIKSKNLINPYTREPLTNLIKNRLNRLIKLSKIFNDKIEISEETDNELSEEKTIELRALSLFQDIDNLGNYTDPRWFWDISNSRTLLIRFIRELADIWVYRAQLSHNVKREICPPLGDPFRTCNININLLQNVSLSVLQNKALLLIEVFIKSGITNENKILGANYVLCAFTLVNSNAAESLPWLYQSVAYF